MTLRVVDWFADNLVAIAASRILAGSTFCAESDPAAARASSRPPGGLNSLADPLSSREGKTYTHEGNSFRLRNAFPEASGVRRLLPIECERLQGLPDDWTAGHPDTVRYRLIGNGMCVPVLEWLAARLAAAIGGFDGLPVHPR